MALNVMKRECTHNSEALGLMCLFGKLLNLYAYAYSQMNKYILI